MANFNKVSVRPEARTELHDLLGLTGAEVSVNHLPAGAGVGLIDIIPIACLGYAIGSKCSFL